MSESSLSQRTGCADGERSMEFEARAAEQAPLHRNRWNEIVTLRQAVIAELCPGRRLQAEDGMPARRQGLARARRRAVERRGQPLDQRRRDVVLDDLALADRLAQARFERPDIHWRSPWSRRLPPSLAGGPAA